MKPETVKNDLCPFVEGQMLLLKDGTYAYVMSVDPETKLNRNDADRIVSVRMGRPYTKGSLFKNNNSESIAIIEDGRNSQSIAVDVGKMQNYSISDLFQKVACSLGILKPEKQTILKRLAAEFYDKQDW